MMHKTGGEKTDRLQAAQSGHHRWLPPGGRPPQSVRWQTPEWLGAKYKNVPSSAWIACERTGSSQ